MTSWISASRIVRLRPRNQRRPRRNDGSMGLSVARTAAEKTFSHDSTTSVGGSPVRIRSPTSWLFRLQCEPVKRMRAQRQEVRPVRHRRKLGRAEQLQRPHALILRQIQFDALREAREIRHYQHPLLFVAADERQHAAVLRVQELQAAAPHRAQLLAQRDHPLHPPQQRVRIVLLRLDVDRFVVVLGVDIHRQVEPLRIGARESGVAVARSTASACARRCGRRGRCCRPCRFRRRSRSPACPAARTAARSSARCAGGRSPAAAPAGGGSPG